MLEIRELGKYYGKKEILRGINLKVDAGELITIAGASGGGKTTLLRCICGLESISAGQIILDEQEIHPFTDQTSETAIGVVFQDFQLFPHLSVLANITLAPINVLNQSVATANDKALGLLKKLGLADKADLYPFQLSGGQKQRVAIARALAMEPQILCYDEPTSALDPDLRQAVENLLLQLKKDGVTQIVVTHDLPFAEKISDEVYPITSLNQLGAAHE